MVLVKATSCTAKAHRKISISISSDDNSTQIKAAVQKMDCKILEKIKL